MPLSKFILVYAIIAIIAALAANISTNIYAVLLDWLIAFTNLVMLYVIVMKGV